MNLLPASEESCSIRPASENADAWRYSSSGPQRILLRQGGVFDFFMFAFFAFFDFFMCSFFAFSLLFPFLSSCFPFFCGLSYRF